MNMLISKMTIKQFSDLLLSSNNKYFQRLLIFYFKKLVYWIYNVTEDSDLENDNWMISRSAFDLQISNNFRVYRFLNS